MSIFDERQNYKPFEYSHITDPLINCMWSSHWTHNEFSFSKDIQDFHTVITTEEQNVIKRTMLLISQIEIAVKSYWGNIGRLLPKPEIADMGAVFGGVEVIHSRAYSEILSKLGFEDEFTDLFNEPIVKNRSTYLRKYNNKIYADDRKQVCYSLALFSIFTEGVSLFSQFYIILAFNRFRSLFKDIANVVAYTILEENIHLNGGIMLLNQIKSEHPELFDDELMGKIIDEAREAIEIETSLIRWMLQGYSNEHVSEDILVNFVKHRMNTCLGDLGIQKLFVLDEDTVTSLSWIDEEIYAGQMTDFFAKKPTAYAKSNKTFDYEEIF